MYKILRFHFNREDMFEGPVFAGDERWESIDDALDELGEHGWQILMPIYGPVRYGGTATTRLDGFILMNKHTSRLIDLTRRLTKLTALIAAQADRLSGLPEGSIERHRLAGAIADSKAKIEEITTRMNQPSRSAPSPEANGAP
ncbi:MAG: hypothetical protein U0531_05640 [Dehalococcoidia bacterium]